MKKLGWLLLCALASAGLAVDSSVTIAGHVPGTLSLPEKSSGKVPAVLLLHGFASQKDEVGDMYKNLAAKLATQGIASLRIDFQGSGDSKIPFEQMTFTNQVSDAQAAFDYLRGRPEVDAARLGLLGFSMGGGVAIELAANAANPVKSLALWSSTSSRSLADIEAGPGPLRKSKAWWTWIWASRKSSWAKHFTAASRTRTWKPTSASSGATP